MMKRLFFIIFMICVIPSPLFADYVDDKLPSDTSIQIKEGARRIIDLGVKKRHAVKITKRMLDNEFDENQILSAYDVIITAKGKDLPEDPIIDKLNEGIAKDVSTDKIIQAMETVEARYEAANWSAKIISDDEDHIQEMTTEIAECMAAGAESRDINTVATLLRQKADSMRPWQVSTFNKRAIRVMKTMARSGVESADALGVMYSAIKNEYNATEMEGLEDSFKLNAQWATSVSDLAKAYVAAINNGATFDTMANNDTFRDGFGRGWPGGMPPGGPAGMPGGGPGAPPPTIGGPPPSGSPGTPGMSIPAGTPGDSIPAGSNTPPPGN